MKAYRASTLWLAAFSRRVAYSHLWILVLLKFLLDVSVTKKNKEY